MTRNILYFAFLIASAVCCSALKDTISTIYNLLVANQDCTQVKVATADVKFTLYTQANRKGITLTSSNINAVAPANRDIFIIHGWLESGLEGWILKMKDTYLNQEPANIIVVDWSARSKTEYSLAFCSVSGVGEVVANIVIYLVKSRRAALNATQLNGFSLGAQISGYVGQIVQARTGSKIQRIVGLDAAGPGFYGRPLNQRLDGTDADFVQGIHTSSWQFGCPYAYATADFYVSSTLVDGCGAKQPGCPLTLGIDVNITSFPIINKLGAMVACNHFRAVVYFIQSITSKDLVGISCRSCRSYVLRQCLSNSHAVMGENCPDTAKGKFYVNVNHSLPFSESVKSV